MRIRHKPWAKPELEACPFYVHEPQQQIGHWRELFEHPERPLYVELGCGKGGFISQAAPAHRDVNFVAMDIKNSPEKYAFTSGAAVDPEIVSQSIALLLEKNVPCEFRTTAVKEFHTPADFTKIGKWIAGAEQYYIQCFEDSGNLLSDGWTRPDGEELQAFLSAVQEFIPQAKLRGVS